MANREAELLKGNPLIDSSYSLSKRWYEDTVFRNQARKVEEKKGFINDYVRSDFHRKFMHRYICRWLFTIESHLSQQSWIKISEKILNSSWFNDHDHSRLNLVRFLDELHIFNHSSLSVVSQLVLNTLLLHKTLPVQLAFSHWVNLPASVIDRPHHVVQVLVSNMSLPLLKFFKVLLSIIPLNILAHTLFFQ